MIRPFARAEWSALPFDGCVDVQGKVILDEAELQLALLRFGEHGTIHEHAADHETIVACLEGRGFTSVGGIPEPLEAGSWTRWPAGVPHRLWTEGATMTTLMVERPT